MQLHSPEGMGERKGGAQQLKLSKSSIICSDSADSKSRIAVAISCMRVFQATANALAIEEQHSRINTALRSLFKLLPDHDARF